MQESYKKRQNFVISSYFNMLPIMRQVWNGLLNAVNGDFPE